MKSPTLKRQFAEGTFQTQSLFMLLTLQMKYQGQADHDTTFKNP